MKYVDLHSKEMLPTSTPMGKGFRVVVNLKRIVFAMNGVGVTLKRRFLC